jgi:NAD(P)-dependent dehydrogenase (short-subunit alcohol dehydrogenase family)
VKSILVTGSSRGLGLEWVRQYAAAGWRVYATCRQPEAAEDLQRLAEQHSQVSVHRLDVTDAAQLTALSGELADAALDLLVNNAGVYFERWGKDRLGSIDYDDWAETFRVNVLGAVRVTEALADHLARAERGLVTAISSHMGCIGDISSPNDYAYRSSKAALNAAFRGLAYELGQRQIGVLLLHPGWVRTRMGGDSAPVTVEESVRGMREQLGRFTPDHSGRFYKYDGRELPW